MVGGDQRRMRLAYSLAFALPGTPVLFYGEEIGMAENLDIPGRLAVRSPMQWTGGPNGGFSGAQRRRLARPLPEGLFGAERINAADQRHDTESFWWFMRNLIRTYRQQPEIGWSTIDVLKQPNPAVLAHVCREKSGWAMVALHNFGAEGCLVPVELSDIPEHSKLVDLMGGLSEHALDAEGRVELSLDGYGYRWLRLQRPGDQPII
jgi:glycosidase